MTVVSKLGVTCIKVEKSSGLSLDALSSGLKAYKAARSGSTSLMAWMMMNKGVMTPTSQSSGSGGGGGSNSCRISSTSSEAAGAPSKV